MSEQTRSPDVKIVFTPSGRQGQVQSGANLLNAARQLGVDIDSVCGGRAMCGRCQIDVGEGHFAKHAITSSASSLSDPSPAERHYAQKRSLPEGRRLACQCQIISDIVIDVPATSQVHNQLIRKQADNKIIELCPPVRLCFIEVQEPDMHDPSGDLRRVINALESQWPDRISGSVGCDLHVIQNLQSALRKGKWKVTVALRDGCQIIAVWPDLKDQILGVAVDIGSTTMSAHICDMNDGRVLASTGIMNPQIRFGEDLMSRVSYSIMNPGGDKEMTLAVRAGLQQMIKDGAEQADFDVTDVLEVVIVGNPVMHHLILGIDPVELGGAPFALAVDSAIDIRASEIGLALHPGSRVYVLPCIAGHVGADAAGMVLAEDPLQEEEITLLIDVGTNAEIILGNKHRLLAASSPTGPAFEGAQISAGQRAAPGAIERLRIDPETFEPRFCVIGSDIWSDEEGFDKVIADIGVTGICGSGIIEALAEMYLTGVITADGVIDGRLANRTSRIEEDGRTFKYRITDMVTILQNDIRAIQLAKAALHAGFRLLMDKMNIEKVDRVMLAGAFGAHIDPKYAMVLGMVPDCQLDKVIAAGNSAGAGARMALLSTKSRREIEVTVREIEKIETAIEADFQDHFVRAMAFPHKTNPYPLLSAAVSLPPRDLRDNAPSAAPPMRRRSARRQR